MLLAAEHDGVRHFHRLDLKRERLTQLTQGPAVHPYAAHLSRNDRGFYFLQGNDLVQADMNGGSRRTHYTCQGDWTFTGEMDISAGERYAALVEILVDDLRRTPQAQFEQQPRCRIRVVELARSAAKDRNWVVTEERRWLSSPRFRPWRSQLLYAREGPWEKVRRRLHLVDLDGTHKVSLRPSSGPERIGPAFWPSDGSRLRYVYFPDGNQWGASIRSLLPETRSETTEAPCSAFEWIAANSDGTAIVGASRRPSGPNIYVLFPKMRREITLCEHRSSLEPYPLAGTDRIDPSAAWPAPALATDSAWVYFASDWEGAPAVYRMAIDDLVETTMG